MDEIAPAEETGKLSPEQYERWNAVDNLFESYLEAKLAGALLGAEPVSKWTSDLPDEPCFNYWLYMLCQLLPCNVVIVWDQKKNQRSVSATVGMKADRRTASLNVDVKFGHSDPVYRMPDDSECDGMVRAWTDFVPTPQEAALTVRKALKLT